MAIDPTLPTNLGTQSGVVGNLADLSRRVSQLESERGYLPGNAITTTQVSPGAIVAANIAAGAITAVHIEAGSIGADAIEAGSINATHIQAFSITAGQIAANTITATEIAANAITTSELAANSVIAENILAGEINATHIAANSITATEIAADSITTSELAANAVTAGNIAAGAIQAGDFAAGAVRAGDILAGEITAGHITISSLSALTANMGTITAGTITGATFRTSASNPRVQMDSTGVWAQDASGTTTFWADSSTGKVMTLAGIGGFNLVGNSSFEDPTGATTGYSVNNASGGTGTIAGSTAQAKHGTTSLIHTSTSATGEPGWSITAANAPSAQVGKSYTASAWVYPTASRTIRLLIQFLNSSLGGISSTTTSITSPIVNEWQRITVKMDAPALTARVRLTGRFVTTTVGDVVYWDALQIEEGQISTAYVPKADEILPKAVAGSQIADNTITAGNILADTITANEIATNAITAVEIAADAVTASEIQAGAVTAGKITVATLSALSADLGTITAGTVTGAILRTSSGASRVQMDSTGFFTTLDSGTTKDVLLSGNGLTIRSGTAAAPPVQRRIQWVDASGNVISDISSYDAATGSDFKILQKSVTTDVSTTAELAAQNVTKDARVTAYAKSGTPADNRVDVSATGSQSWVRTILDGVGESDFGLAETNNAWTTWPINWTNVTVGNATQTAKYIQYGKIVFYKLWFKLGSTSAITGTPRFTLPVAPTLDSATANTPMIGYATLLDAGTAHYPGVVDLNAAAPGSNANITVMSASGAYAQRTGVTSTVPFTWTTNDEIYAQGFYVVS